MAEHDTLSRYTDGGCRCDECRAARSAYRRDYTARTGKTPDRRRFPWQPLEDLLRARLGPAVVAAGTDGGGIAPMEGATDRAMADTLGVGQSTVREWRRRGAITSRQADRAAITLGLHPALIWDDWYSEAAS